MATLVLGGALRSVTLADDGGGLVTRDLSSPLSDFDAAVVCLAGSAAERRHARGCDPVCAATDRDVAYRFAAARGTGLEGVDTLPMTARRPLTAFTVAPARWWRYNGRPSSASPLRFSSAVDSTMPIVARFGMDRRTMNEEERQFLLITVPGTGPDAVGDYRDRLVVVDEEAVGRWQSNGELWTLFFPRGLVVGEGDRIYPGLDVTCISVGDLETVTRRHLHLLLEERDEPLAQITSKHMLYTTYVEEQEGYAIWEMNVRIHYFFTTGEIACPGFRYSSPGDKLEIYIEDPYVEVDYVEVEGTNPKDPNDQKWLCPNDDVDWDVWASESRMDEMLEKAWSDRIEEERSETESEEE
ncbi:hypothetical protein FHP25_32665 [Vineibacter terrae]|uniref:Uncharacterized protein n=1 Tax=Vineibacter terrae TaxID=2586908 RepID=A0A5C8PCQ9_9HYPH|nr:hypothetical protein [Vineibacter terrae]TXL70874.1 hypothetical protein FHP25_32665 [Vineibacter terrae]